MKNNQSKTWTDCINEVLQLIPRQDGKNELLWPNEMVAKMNEKNALEELIRIYENDILQHDMSLSENKLPSFLDKGYIKWITFYCNLQPPKEYHPNTNIDRLRRPAYLINNNTHNECDYAKLIEAIEEEIVETVKDEKKKKSILHSVLLCELFNKSNNKMLRDLLQYPWIFMLNHPECKECNCPTAICWSIHNKELFVCKSSNTSEENKRLQHQIIQELVAKTHFKKDEISKGFQLFLDRLLKKDGFENCLSHYVKLPVPGMKYSKGESYLALKMPEDSKTIYSQMIARYVRSLSPVLGLIPTAMIADISFNYAPIAGEKRENDWKLVAGSIANSMRNIIAHPQSFIQELSKSVQNNDTSDFVQLALQDISDSLELLHSKINLLMTRTFGKRTLQNFENKPTDILSETIKCFIRMLSAFGWSDLFRDKKNSFPSEHDQQYAKIDFEFSADTPSSEKFELKIPMDCPICKFHEKPLIKCNNKMVTLNELKKIDIRNLHLSSIQALLEEYFINYFKYGISDTLKVEWSYKQKNKPDELSLKLSNSIDTINAKTHLGYGAGEELIRYICQHILDANCTIDKSNNEYVLTLNFNR